MRRRGYGGDARAVNNTLETINAAATVIASRENPHPQPHVQKKRWGSWLSISSCFGYHKNRKRISHVALVPETTPGTQPSSSAVAAAAVSSTQAAVSITLPFVAPPSSPASFLQSEPPSAAQSPAGMLSLNSASASIYSPGGPASIFAIGPYAHETQLVSPPVFSTFTTEPSTAPFTPPPESVHLTTPSSPEVPFAQLLDPNKRNGETFQRIQISQYDFHSYQLHPGSPAGQLISPRSAFSASGTSSPYLPDSECGSNLHFQTSDPPKLLNFDKLSICDENPESCQGSGSLTPDAVRSSTHGGFHPSHRVPEIKTSPHGRCNRQNEISVNHHRVSFELSAQEVIKCVENKAMAWNKALTKFRTEAYRGDREENYSSDSRQSDKFHVTETPKDASQKTNDDAGDASRVHQKDPSLTHSTTGKDFNFDSAVAGKSEEGSSNDWSFFPMIQAGLS